MKKFFIACLRIQDSIDNVNHSWLFDTVLQLNQSINQQGIFHFLCQLCKLSNKYISIMRFKLCLFPVRYLQENTLYFRVALFLKTYTWNVPFQWRSQSKSTWPSSLGHLPLLALSIQCFALGLWYHMPENSIQAKLMKKRRKLNDQIRHLTSTTLIPFWLKLPLQCLQKKENSSL